MAWAMDGGSSGDGKDVSWGGADRKTEEVDAEVRGREESAITPVCRWGCHLPRWVMLGGKNCLGGLSVRSFFGH